MLGSERFGACKTLSRPLGDLAFGKTHIGRNSLFGDGLAIDTRPTDFHMAIRTIDLHHGATLRTRRNGSYDRRIGNAKLTPTGQALHCKWLKRQGRLA